MKKFYFYIIAFALCLSIALALTAFAAEADTDIVAEFKDGLSANMMIFAYNETIKVDLEVENVSADNISNVAVTLTLPEGFRCNEAVVTRPVNLDLMLNETKTLSYSIVNTYALPETEASTEVVEPSGCGAVISSAAVIFTLICAVFFLMKNPKCGTACLLACLMLVPLALPARAVTTERKIELEGIVTYDEKEYPIKVTVSYDYTFTEARGVDTKGMDKFDITYYYGPQGQDLCNEEYIKKIAECGFTSVPVEGYDPAINKTALGYLRKYGLTCAGLKDNRLIHAQTLTSQPEIDALVFETVNDYKDYFDVITEWWIRDEPSAADFPALARVVDALRRYDPDRGVMINLFPTYASEKQLGTSTYQQHLDKYIETVKPDYISYDHYHFQKNTTRKGFFENLEIVRDTAIANEIDPMLIILLTEHMSYADLTKYQIEWEVNMCLTYGMKRISYFTFWLCQSLLNEGWSNACMDTTGKIYPHYYDVQEINKWLLPLGDQLFDKNSTAVFHYKMRGGASLEKGCEAYKSYGALGEISADAGLVIGFFNDESFMITNKMYTDTENSRNTVEFLDIASGLEYFDTTTSEWKDAEADGTVTRNENGVLTYTFEPGEGMLFRVKGK
jgi:hypothetical protein